MPLSIIEITSNSGKAMLYAEKCVFYTSAKDGIGRKKTVFLPHIISVELADSELVLGTACGEARFIFDNAIDAITFEEALVSQITNAPTASAVAEHKMRVGEEDFAAALFGGDFDMPQSTASALTLRKRTSCLPPCKGTQRRIPPMSLSVSKPHLY